MQILFGEIPDEYIEGFGDEGFTAPDIPGEFYYKLEMLDTETFKVIDSVGRMVPLDYGHIDHFITALTLMRDNTQELIQGIKERSTQLKELNIELG